MSVETKVAQYRGRFYEVPTWSKYIAADLDGDIHAYEQNPEWKGYRYSSTGGKFSLVNAKDSSQPPCQAL
jgi:hypothetical protein